MQYVHMLLKFVRVCVYLEERSVCQKSAEPSCDCDLKVIWEPCIWPVAPSPTTVLGGSLFIYSSFWRLNCNCSGYWSLEQAWAIDLLLSPNGSGTIHLATTPQTSIAGSGAAWIKWYWILTGLMKDPVPVCCITMSFFENGFLWLPSSMLEVKCVSG